MTATLDDVTKKKDKPEPTTEQKVAEEPVLGQEMTEHLGHESTASRRRGTCATAPGPRRC